MDYGMDMYNNGYRSIVDKAIKVTKDGLITADTAEKVQLSDTLAPTPLGGRAKHLRLREWTLALF